MNKNFLELGIEAPLVGALEKMGIAAPLEIQRQTIPAALAGGNVVGQSATGTGKTLAYLLPLVQRVDSESAAVQAVILAPTQELGMQIFRQAELLCQGTGIRCASLIGGANMARQIDKLKKKPQVIIGSAGRIMDLNGKGKLRLDAVRILALDEADRLLDDQSRGAVSRVVEAAAPRQCQYLLFSATISAQTLKRADFAAAPVIVRCGEKMPLPAAVEHCYVAVDFRDKAEMLRKLAAALRVKRGLVFVNRNDAAAALAEKLRLRGVKAVALYAAAGKTERKKALEDFSRGKLQLLVASDVAARGLDIADIDFVFNVDTPEEKSSYLHRAGRTGRVGRSGCVITLADRKELGKLNRLGEAAGISLQEKFLRQGAVAAAPKRRVKTAAQPVKAQKREIGHTKK